MRRGNDDLELEVSAQGLIARPLNDPQLNAHSCDPCHVAASHPEDRVANCEECLRSSSKPATEAMHVRALANLAYLEYGGRRVRGRPAHASRSDARFSANIGDERGEALCHVQFGLRFVSRRRRRPRPGPLFDELSLACLVVTETSGCSPTHNSAWGWWPAALATQRQRPNNTVRRRNPRKARDARRGP